MFLIRTQSGMAMESQNVTLEPVRFHVMRDTVTVTTVHQMAVRPMYSITTRIADPVG
jgi:hypothetical protein